MPLLILASGSPRRAELLRQIGLSFKIVPSEVEEEIPKHFSTALPKQIVRLAIDKAKAVQQHYPHDIILGADTVVVLGKMVMGKPATAKEALGMLKRLSGKTHFVFTGVAIVRKKKFLTDWSETSVKFRRLSQDFIRQYVQTGEPMDKAGAYGIQGLGALCVERIDGDFFNVMGLPLVKVWDLLHRISK